MSEWRTISIRQELIKEIETTIKKGQYRSLPEFVSEAIRLRLEELMRTEAISTGKPQETLNMEDSTLKVPPNPRGEEKVQHQAPMPCEQTQPQTCRELALVQQKDTDATPR